MRTLSSTAIAEKNKLATDSVFLLLVAITIPGLAQPVRVAANNESVTWNGQTWQPFPFEIDELVEESKGEVPQIVIRVGNESRVMEQYLQDYDAYTKTNGFSPITCDLYVVNSKNLAKRDPRGAAHLRPQADRIRCLLGVFHPRGEQPLEPEGSAEPDPPQSMPVDFQEHRMRIRGIHDDLQQDPLRVPRDVGRIEFEAVRRIPRGGEPGGPGLWSLGTSSGSRSVDGGRDPAAGLDCWGLVMAAMRKYGREVP